VKNILIIYPHWPPSNLAGVHRARLIANFLPDMHWHPIVLTVSPEFYEEELDPDITKTVSDKVEVIHTNAFKIRNPRFIGDIGLRAFPFLLRRAFKLISDRKIDFIWIPIPSFYTALLGRILYHKTKVPYGIDYIDPWIRDIKNRNNLRAKISLFTARVLEPIAIKYASLISGVSTAYYTPMMQRNFKHKRVLHVGMPYGFDPKDHGIKINDIIYPWDPAEEIQPIVYAGAFLPNSHIFIKALFRSVKDLIDKDKWDNRKQLFFLGTGYYTGTTIADYAKQYGVEDVVHEIRDRFPYLHVLNYLDSAHAVLVIGSTEKHYTASKTYQALLSHKPVLAVFHKESSAITVLEECRADNLLIRYEEGMTDRELMNLFAAMFIKFNSDSFCWQPDLQMLNKYSARSSAMALIEKLNEIV
jgi:hypothetical protein